MPSRSARAPALQAHLSPHGRDSSAGRSSSAGSPPELSWRTLISPPSRPTSTTRTSASTRCVETMLRSAGAAATDVAAEAIEAWAVRRLEPTRMRSTAFASGGSTSTRPTIRSTSGAAGSHDDDGVLVVNWQAPAARPFYTATPAEPHGVTLRRRFRAPGPHAHGHQRRSARRLARRRCAHARRLPARGARAQRATRACATSSPRSRPTSTA